MLKNHFRIAFRNLRRNQVSTVINILGLSAGICACIAIYLISSYEFSFDNFHPGKERVYRIMGDVTRNAGDKLHFGKLPYGVSQGGNELTGIESIAGIIPFKASITIPRGEETAKYAESSPGQTKFITTAIVQPAWFDIFRYRWLAGDAATALNAPSQVVLTKTKAHQYFGSEPLHAIIGRKIIYDDSLTVTVSGIIQDWKGNTDLGFTDFISASTLRNNYLKSRFQTDQWGEQFMNTWTFVKLSANATPAKLENQLQLLVNKNAGPGIKLSLWLEPLRDLHFNADVIESPIRTADRSTLYGLMAIALFILIIAVINFINLSTAQSIQRAKEIGVRKVLGSSRYALMIQFLTETFVVTVFAISIACLLVNPVLNIFRSFIPAGVQFHFFDPQVIAFLVLTALITSLLAGLYPASVLSSYLPALSLKGLESKAGGQKWLLRKGLIVFQFTVSLVFIIGSIVITQQLAFTREKDPGFNKDAIIIVPTPWSDSLSKINLLAERIKQLPAVNNIALQWLSPMTDNGRVMQLKLKESDEKEIEVSQVAGDANFINVYQIKLLAGKNLSHTDSAKELIINRTFLRYMGFSNPQDAISKQLYWNNKPYNIVGVVDDFHTASFHDPITPLCIVNRPDREHTLAIKLAANPGFSVPFNTTISQIEQLWKQQYPASSFNYTFYDESLALLYEKDEQTATLVNMAMIIAIFISCIGLFGLMLFTAQKRAKEISIRKISGAGISNIVVLLSRDFVTLVIIALLVASPVAWYFMNEWLNSFSYRIRINGWVFLMAGSGAVLIALLTISYHALRAAFVNPVKNLRSE